MSIPWRFSSYTPSFPNGTLIGIDGSSLTNLGGDMGRLTSLDEGYPSPPKTTHQIAMFGDTYFNLLGSTVRKDDGTGIIENCIALTTCQNNIFSLQYYQGGTATQPAAFFQDSYGIANGTKFGVIKPFMYQGKLYCTLYRRHIDNGKSCGSVIARINNPLSSPQTWKIDYLTLTNGGAADGVPNFGLETIVVNDQLIIYGNYDFTIAVCIPLTSLASTLDGSNLFDKGVRYWSTSNIWKTGYYSSDIANIGITSTAGFSCRYNSGIKKWQVIYTDTTLNGGFPDYASILVGDSPLGPWDEPARVLGYFSEMTETSTLFNNDKVVYGIAENIDFCSNPLTQVSVVYTVGSLSAMINNDFTYQESNSNVYRVFSRIFNNPYGI